MGLLIMCNPYLQGFRFASPLPKPCPALTGFLMQKRHNGIDIEVFMGSLAISGHPNRLFHANRSEFNNKGATLLSRALAIM
jgi:hypothetical protein